MSFTKLEIHTCVRHFCQNHGLDPKAVVVGFGGAMVLHGLRNTAEDIDMGIPEHLWDLFKLSEDWEQVVVDGEVLHLDCNGLSLHRGYLMQGLPIPSEEVGGTTCYTIEGLYLAKHALNRSKDQLDLAILRKWLEEHGTPCEYCGCKLPAGFYEYGPEHGWPHCPECKGI